MFEILPGQDGSLSVEYMLEKDIVPIVKKHILIPVLSSLGALGCYKISKSIETDTSTDIDADTGTDADTDSDTDADTDIESDLDKDTDTASDTETGTGPDTHTATDTVMNIASDCADGHGRLDENTGLCWQHPQTNDYYNWQEAIDYCEVLILGGHDDWRLPSREDFIEMLGGCDSDVLGGHYGFCNRCAQSATCTALFASDADRHWSSSPVVDVPFAWYLDFSLGYVNIFSVFFDYNVRCVRSGP